MLVAGALIFAAVWVAGATIAFWTVDGGEFTNAFTYGGNFLAQYPISIYGEWLRRFLAYRRADGVRLLLPGAVHPRQGRPARACREWLQFASPARGARGRAAVAGVVWRVAVRRYRSVGS